MIFMAPRRVVRVRLSEALRERGWTQRVLADKTGLSKNAVSKLVNNPRQISMETIQALCDALGVQPGDLIIYEETEN